MEKQALVKYNMLSISIITVCFNSELYIEETIKSVLSQSYPNIEYIIIDGKSTDRTMDILKSYQDKISYWMSEPDTSMYDAINKGLKKATGDYIWILNSDDYLPYPTVVEEIVKKISDIPGEFGYYGNVFIKENDTISTRRTFQVNRTQLLLSKHCSFVPHPALLVSAASLKVVASYDQSFRYASDYDYILKLLEHGELKYVNLPFSVFRRHTGSITSSGKIDAERLEVLQKNGYYTFSNSKRWFNFITSWIKYKIVNILS